MNIFRKKSLIEDVEPVFHVYRTPDSEVVGHPARTGHVLGILSSIAMRNERSDYTIHLGMVRYHRDLRMSAHKDVEQGRLEELLTPEGQSFPYIAFSVAQTAHFGLLPPIYSPGAMEKAISPQRGGCTTWLPGSSGNSGGVSHPVAAEPRSGFTHTQ